jgi:tetratricopeptide (TPR) repeat protein
MRQFVRNDIAHRLHVMGPAEGLLAALYTRGELRLEYESSKTRTASEAFDDRAGNCLSLVIMTAAFAKDLDLAVEYHSAQVQEVWSRDGDLLLGSGHVNVTIGYNRIVGDRGFKQYGRDSLLVDFLPADEIRGLPEREISEDTVVAMYMNNRAVEALVRGDIDEAYGWAREAIRRSPEFDKSYNTLGVIYLRHGNLAQATRVFRYGLERGPENPTVISNLADTLERMGHEQEATALRFRLARLDPDPPYYFFNLGMDALQRNDFQAARDFFAKEVARADYSHEFHFWLAVAYYKLGDSERARKQLFAALERSTAPGDHKLYAAKLAWLKSNAHAGHQAPEEMGP